MKKESRDSNCEKAFLSSRELKSHTTNIHTDIKHKCEICFKMIKGSISQLKCHIRQAHQGKKKDYICTPCGKPFANKTNLQYHKDRTHKGLKFGKCDQCLKEFTTAYSLKNHIKIVHEGQKPFHCDLCDTSFRSKLTLAVHKTEVHNEGGVFKRHECGACDKKYYKKDSLERHIKKCHEEPVDESVQCNYCFMTLKNKYLLKAHVRRIHDVIKDFKCNACEKSFVTAAELRSHNQNIHLDIKPIQCEICKIEIKGLELNLKLHMKSVHGKKKKEFICPTCSKPYSSKKYLKDHVDAVHLGLKLSKCVLCHKELANKWAMEDHVLRVHEGQKII